MANFYFVRHGEADYDEAGTKFYKGWGFNMCPLSKNGIEQIKKTAKDSRLTDAEIIISSPYMRAFQSAAILSKELNLDIKIETDLHEWLTDKNFELISDEEETKSYEEFDLYKGRYPENEEKKWESADLLKKRVNKVLEKYKSYKKVIVVTHGMLMDIFLERQDIYNGKIEEFIYE